MKTSLSTRAAAAALFAGTVALAAPAGAAEYQLLIHESPQALALRQDTGAAGTAYWRAYRDISAEMQAAGVLRGGGAVHADGAARVPAGPLPATTLGGWFVVDVATPAEARRWAARIPAARDGGSVEVRALVAMPAMNPTR